MKNLVSIISLNYNGQKYLKKFIDSIKKQTYKKIEVIIVDNNSTDNSVFFVKKNYPQVKLVQNKKNYGFAEGNNRGIAHAKGEYLLFLNNDTELFPDTVEKLFKSYAPKSILSACQIPLHGPKKNTRTGAGADIFGYPYMERNIKKTKVFYADGAAFFLKKSDYLLIGGFDKELFIFQEDIDFSWRARLYGFSIVPCWEAKLYHHFGGTVKVGIDKSHTYVTSYFRRYYNERNVIRNILKNYSAIYAVIILSILLCLHVAEIATFLVLGKLKVVQCYLRAYMWNISQLRNTLKTRALIQKKRKISDEEIVKHMYATYSKIDMILRVGFPKFV